MDLTSARSATEAALTADVGKASRLALLNPPVNILIVDDEPKNLTVLQSVLECPGYRLVTAGSADEALLKLIAEEFALLVLDIHMPDMDGFELANMIKCRKKTADVPILFLTAYFGEEQYVLEGYETGAVDYLHKPINPAILRAKVAVFAELHRKSREAEAANRALLAEISERREAQAQLARLNNELEQRVEERTASLLQANEAVRESEQRLELALKGANLGVWDWDLVAGSVRYDARWAEMLGFTPEEVLPRFRFWEKRVHPDDLPGVLATLNAHLAGRTPDYRAEYRLRRKDGEWIWVLTSGQVVERDEAGRALRVCGVHLDITARKQAVEDLRRSEAFARSVVESSADCVKGLTLEGRLLWMNENGKRLKEVCDFEALKGCDWAAFWDAGEARVEAEAALAAARGGGVGRFRGFCPTASGTPRWWDVIVTPIPGPDGRVELLLAVSRDVTDAWAAEETLREADRRKDEFLAMLAHELRNPLSAIGSAVALLRAKGPADPDLVWGHDVIDRQTAHLTRLIDDLLDVSRITRGKVQLRRQPLDLRDVIGRAVEGVRPFIDSKRHELTLALPDSPLPADADPARLEQVVGNLLANATKYTDEEGRITLSAGREGGEAVIRVRDSGVGIPADQLPHIFGLFAQVDTSLDRSQGGLGIGLTLVRSLVELHGGSVAAASDGPGQGSEFTVRLPLLAGLLESRAGAPGGGETATAGEAVSLRILVIDDNTDSARGMGRLLKIQGHDVRTAYDGLSAMEAAYEFCPEVVLLDIGLPGMNGYQVARALRRDDRTSAATLIAVTGYGQEQDRSRSREAGFDHHLIKPIDFERLRSLLVGPAGTPARSGQPQG
jgi:PAS domain S-box-containing protein